MYRDHGFLKRPLFLGLLFFFFSNLSEAQNSQVGVSLGPSAHYVHEHYYSNSEYYEGLSFQADFTFLDSNKLAKYGFSAYSNSVHSYFKFFDSYRYNGFVTNTGLVITKYYERRLSERFIANVQLGTGLNLENDAYDKSRLMLNLTFGAEVKYAISNKWFLLVKGIAVGQDVPNIVRYYTYGDSRIAGEDLHLISLIGVAVNIGNK